MTGIFPWFMPGADVRFSVANISHICGQRILTQGYFFCVQMAGYDVTGYKRDAYPAAAQLPKQQYKPACGKKQYKFSAFPSFDRA